MKIKSSFALLLAAINVIAILCISFLDGSTVAKNYELYESPSNIKSIIDKVDKSIFKIYCKDATGSGWAINLDSGFSYIVTNSHVVQQCSDDKRKIYASNEYYGVLEAKLYSIDSSMLIDAKDGLRDLALLKVSSEQNIKGLDIQISKPKVGQWVSSIGYPGGSKMYTTGHISGITWHGISADLSINYGNSGGPVINALGQVVGTTYAFSEKNSYEGYIQPMEYHCDVVFNCMDGRPSNEAYGGYRIQECLGYITQLDYNLSRVSCGYPAAGEPPRVFKTSYRISSEINKDERHSYGFALCQYSIEIHTIVEGEHKIYCANAENTETNKIFMNEDNWGSLQASSRKLD